MRACFQALQAQSCHGDDLWEAIPACTGIFSCADSGSQDAEVDGGMAADGGSVCAYLPGTNGSFVLQPCSSSSDCGGVALPGGPYCVQGYCVSGPCGASYFPNSNYSCPFAQVGEPCDGDLPILGNGVSQAPWGTPSASVCSSGLTCAGLKNDKTFKVCSVPQDLGGPCTEDAAISGCFVGLICQCGTCQMPPSHGPCVSGWCQVGTSYCDPTSATCKPVTAPGGDCSVGPQVCPPSLACDDASTCEPYLP